MQWVMEKRTEKWLRVSRPSKAWAATAAGTERKQILFLAPPKNSKRKASTRNFTVGASGLEECTFHCPKRVSITMLYRLACMRG